MQYLNIRSTARRHPAWALAGLLLVAGLLASAARVGTPSLLPNLPMWPALLGLGLLVGVTVLFGLIPALGKSRAKTTTAAVESALTTSSPPAVAGTWEWFPQGGATWRGSRAYAGQGLQGLLGIGYGDVVGRIHADDVNAAEQALQALIEGRSNNYQARYRLHGPQGWRWVAEQGHALDRDRDGKLRHATGSLRDVHELQLAQQLLGLHEVSLAAASDAIFVLDRRGRLQACNPSCSKMLRRSPERLVGRRLLSFFASAADQTSVRAVARQVQQCGEWRGELRLGGNSAASSLPLSVTVQRVVPEGSTSSHFVGICQKLPAVALPAVPPKKLPQKPGRFTQAPDALRFMDYLNHATEQTRRLRNRHAVLFVELAGFRSADQHLGQRVGDELLRLAHARLSRALRGYDIAYVERDGAREGGDAHAGVLCEYMQSVADTEKLARRLLQDLGKPYNVDGSEILLVPACGITLCPDDSSKPAELLQHAQLAMERAVSDPIERCHFHADAQGTGLNNRLQLRQRLRDALRDGKQIVPFYDPIVDMHSGQLSGAEVTLRWRQDDGSLLLPESFLEAAEGAGILPQLTELTLRWVCAQLKKMEAAELLPKDFYVGLKLSPEQFNWPGLAACLGQILQSTGVLPRRLAVHVSAGALPQAAAGLQLATLAACEVRVIVDDLAHSQLQMTELCSMPIDGLKVAPVFLSNGDLDKRHARAILSLATCYGLRCIVSEVATADQLTALRGMSCAAWQGSLCSQPLSAVSLMKRLQAPRAAVSEVSEVSKVA